MLEQIDDGGAVQLDVVQGRPQALDTALANIEAQLQAAHLLEAVLRQRPQYLQAAEVDKQELVLEGKIFLQVAIAAEGVQRIGNQRLFLGKAYRLHLVARDLQRQRITVGCAQRLATGTQRHQLDPGQVAQQAQVEHLADVALTGQMQAQAPQLQLAQMPVAGHLQAQTEQGPVALDRIGQPAKRQGQHLGGIAGAEPAAHLIDRPALHRRVPRHSDRRPRTLQRIELQDAERRQRPHVVGPQQVHQRMAELRQLVIELLPQTPGEKGKAFQQPFHIRVPPGLPEKRSQRRTTLGETPAQLAQRGQFALVVVVEGHGLPAWGE